MNFHLWLEVKATEELVQKLKDELIKDKYATIWLDPDGNVRLGFPERTGSYAGFKKSADNKVGILSDKKTIKFEMIGDKVKSAHKKLVKFLYDNGIIDDSWELENDYIGLYIGNKFQHKNDPLSPKKVSDVKNLDTISPSIKNITLYHGTSSKDWEQIKKKGGLFPLFVGSQVHGYESRAKHEYNRDFVYLATDVSTAWDYAKMRAKSMNQSQPSHSYLPEEAWWVKPIVLRVSVPDVSKLRADDDVANNRMRKIATQLWKSKSAEEQKSIMDELSKMKGFEVSDPSIATMIWRDTDDGFYQILSRLNPKIYSAWLASLLRYDQVAYKGFIPLKFIQEIPIYPEKKDEFWT